MLMPMVSLMSTTLEVINLSVTNGQLSYDPDTTTYAFQPDANFNGIARFNYSITDNNGGTVSNTVELNIVAINDAPTATFDVDQTIAENSNALTGLLAATDVDGNDGTTFALVSAAIDGADPVTEVNGLTIAPDGNWNTIPKTPPTTLLLRAKAKSSLSPIKSVMTQALPVRTASPSPLPALTTLLLQLSPRLNPPLRMHWSPSLVS